MKRHLLSPFTSLFYSDLGLKFNAAQGSWRGSIFGCNFQKLTVLKTFKKFMHVEQKSVEQTQIFSRNIFQGINFEFYQQTE